MKKYLSAAVFLCVLVFNLANVSAEGLVWQADDAYLGDIAKINLEKVVIHEGIKADINELRAQSVIQEGTSKLQNIFLTAASMETDLKIKTTIKWWDAKTTVVPGHYETKTRYEDVYEPGHYDRNGNWTPGRTISRPRDYQEWVPESSYTTHSLGVDYEAYDSYGNKVFSVSYDKSSDYKDNYDLLRTSAKDFFGKLSDAKRNDKRKGPSMKAKVKKIMAAEDNK